MKDNVWIVVLLAPVLCMGVTIGQIDTFETGTLEGWTIALGPGGGAPDPLWAPANVTGGMTGMDDNYLQLRSIGGGGSGSRLTVMNVTTWTGNYLAAGVNAVRMDVRNLGNTDLTLRLALETLQPMGPPVNVAVSTAGVPVAAGGGWTTILFPIDASSLTPLVGTLPGVLGDVDVLRIFHNAAAAFPPGPVVASVGIDNINALAIPEPSTMLLAGAALAGIVMRRKL